jgi:Zn-dependent metalloprotease
MEPSLPIGSSCYPRRDEQDLGGLAVDGIGISKAEKIAYRAWVHYLHPSSNFKSARTASLQAAADLYGSDSPERAATARAWSAVGVN